MASASCRSDICVGVLDVGHDQPARGGRGDAEVHVVLDHDLLGRLVPRGVDARGCGGPRCSRALATSSSGLTLTSWNSRSMLQPLDELHRAGHVDGDELGDVRGGERRGDHRLGGHLAHALDRDARLPLARRAKAGACMPRGRRRAGCACTAGAAAAVPAACGLDVVAGDDAALARAGHARPGRRRGPWRTCAPAAWPGHARRPARAEQGRPGRRAPSEPARRAPGPAAAAGAAGAASGRRAGRRPCGAGAWPRSSAAP